MAAQTLVAQRVNVVLIDMVKPRLAMAAEISSGTVVDINQENPVDKISEMTNGKGAAFVLEAAGPQSALDQALDLVKTRGTVVTNGLYRERG